MICLTLRATRYHKTSHSLCREKVAVDKFLSGLQFGVMVSPELGSTLHLVLEAIAYAVGYQYYRALRRTANDPFSEHQRLWLLVATIAGALVGSRLLGVLENPEVSLHQPSILASVMGNKTIVGALLGGLAGTELLKSMWKERRSSGDLLVYPLLLGMMIGRLGCFFGGLGDGTCGIATSLPWAIDFGDGIPRHPAQLYEILFLGLLWLSLRSIEQHVVLRDGARFKIFMTAYLLFRLSIEFIKLDPPMALGLSTIQWSCVAGLVYYYRVFLQPTHLVTHRAV